MQETHTMACYILLMIVLMRGTSNVSKNAFHLVSATGINQNFPDENAILFFSFIYILYIKVLI